MELPAEFEAMSEKETRDVGRRLGRELIPDDVVSIHGALGAGKTVFVRGLAEGIGAEPSEVASPTFALLHEYDAKGCGPDLVHLDLYRLADEERELREIGLPDLLAGKITAVEWPGPRAEAILQATYRVRIEAKASGSRRIRVERCA